MQKKIAIVITHGINKNTNKCISNFNSLKSLLIQKIGEEKFQKYISWNPLFWQGLSQHDEDSYYDTVTKDLYWKKLRILIKESVIDTLTYRANVFGDVKGPESFGEILTNINQTFQDKLDDIENKLGPETPIIFIAVSLSTVLANNFLLSKQQCKKTKKTSPLQSINTLLRFYTLGAPIALYALKRLQSDEIPILKNVHSALPTKFLEEISNKSKNTKWWQNYFSKYDILGYPLQPLNSEYNDSVEDKIVTAGGLITKFTPLSHFHYYTKNSNAHKFISADLQNIIDAFEKL